MREAGHQRSEVRQDSVTVALKMGEVESTGAAGLRKLERQRALSPLGRFSFEVSSGL